jgi:hypothetical protein
MKKDIAISIRITEQDKKDLDNLIKLKRKEYNTKITLTDLIMKGLFPDRPIKKKNIKIDYIEV